MTARFATILFLLCCSCGDSASSPAAWSHVTEAGADATAESAADGSADGPYELPDSGGADGPALDAPAAAIVRIGGTFEIPTIPAAAPKRTPDVCYDRAHDSYVVVHGNNRIGGAFVSADGVVVGQPFTLTTAEAWSQAPRVACAPDGACLAAWHDTREDPNSPRVWARAFSQEAGQPKFAGPEVLVTTEPSHQEIAPALAWSATSSEFLVAWQRSANHDIHAQRLSATAALIGAAIVLTDSADWEGDVDVAWNEVRDEFLVVHTWAGGGTARVIGRRVQAGTGAVVGAEIVLGEAAGTWIPQISYLPWADRYLVGWYAAGLAGRFLQGDGTLMGSAFPIATGHGAYDGFALALQTTTGQTGAVFHGTTDEDWAAALSPQGETGTVIEVTSSPGDEGNFNPRVAAHATRGEWLVVTSRGYATLVGQRFGVP